MARMVSTSVHVVLRFRPLNKVERDTGAGEFVEYIDDNAVAVLEKGSQASQPTHNANDKVFTYDSVIGPGKGQQDVFEVVGLPTVESVLKGYNSTILAYGQTGSGKTHSMLGPEGGTADFLTPSSPQYANRGVIPRVAVALFERLAALVPVEVSWKVTVSSFELYRESIHDLLTDGPQLEYRIREDTINGRGIYVDNLFERQCRSAADLIDAVRLSVSKRTVASTKSNETSSRSHALTVITVMQINHVQGDVMTVSRLNLVDLAGSEKVGKTQASGDRLKEAQTINLSLTLLGNVIYKLTDGKSGYIPYRNSKLTRILQDSFGGNSTTTLMCHCSSAVYNREETISTLRFASRAKQIKNRPRVNRDLSLKELQLAYAQALDTIRGLEEKVQIIGQAGGAISPSRMRASAQVGGATACSDPAHADLHETITNLLLEIEDLKKEVYSVHETAQAANQQMEFYRLKTLDAESSLRDLTEKKLQEEAFLRDELLQLQEERRQLLRSVESPGYEERKPAKELRAHGDLAQRRVSTNAGHIGNLRRLGGRDAAKNVMAQDDEAGAQPSFLPAEGVTVLSGIPFVEMPVVHPNSSSPSDVAQINTSARGIAKPLTSTQISLGVQEMVPSQISEFPQPVIADVSAFSHAAVQTERDHFAAEARQTLEASRLETKSLMEQNLSLTKLVADKDAALERLGETIEDSNNRMDDLLKEIDDLKQRLESRERENGLMRRILEELNINIEEHMALLGSEQQRNAWLTAEADKLRQKAQTLQDSHEQQEYCDMASMELMIKTEDLDAVENELGYLSYSALTGAAVSEGTRLSCLDTVQQLNAFLSRLLGTLQGRAFNTSNLESQRLSIVSDAIRLQTRVDSARSLLSDTAVTQKTSPTISAPDVPTQPSPQIPVAPTEPSGAKGPRRISSGRALSVTSFPSSSVSTSANTRVRTHGVLGGVRK